MKGDALDIQAKLDQEKVENNKLKEKLEARDDMHEEALSKCKAHCREEVSRYKRASRENEGKVVEMCGKVTQYKQTINDLEMGKYELIEEKSSLKSIIRNLQDQLDRGPNAPPLQEPTLAPHPNAKIRDDPEYKHPQAPRQNKLYKFFMPVSYYPKGTGKVRPAKYGSNGHWDLGLCHVHFSTPSQCKYGEHCEYRHHPLTLEENIYITNLVPNGPKFLKTSVEIMYPKTTRNAN